MAEEVIVEAAADGAATNGGLTLTANVDHTVAAENHNRDKLIMSADTADVWVTYGTGAAVVGTGIRIKAGAEEFVETGWKGEVHCKSIGAAVFGVIETSYQTGAFEGELPTGANTFVPSGPSDSYSADAIAASEANAVPPGTPYPHQP